MLAILCTFYVNNCRVNKLQAKHLYATVNTFLLTKACIFLNDHFKKGVTMISDQPSSKHLHCACNMCPHSIVTLAFTLTALQQSVCNGFDTAKCDAPKHSLRHIIIFTKQELISESDTDDISTDYWADSARHVRILCYLGESRSFHNVTSVVLGF